MFCSKNGILFYSSVLGVSKAGRPCMQVVTWRCIYTRVTSWKKTVHGSLSQETHLFHLVLVSNPKPDVAIVSATFTDKR